MRPIDYDEMIELAEEVAGPGVGHGHRRRASFETMRTLAVELPDGKRATRRTKHSYKLAAAVFVPADDVLPEHWTVYRWSATVSGGDRARRDAQNDGYRDVRILPVVDLMDPSSWSKKEDG